MATYPFEPYAELPTLQSAVTDSFCQLVEQTLASQDTFSVSLSGGSTPKRVYEMLASRDLPWDRIHLFWGDERNVPHDHADSNYRMVKTALLDHVAIKEANVHPVPVAVDSPAEGARAYAQEIEAFFGTAMPTFDLVLLGMGDDAHTASLFPGTKAISESDASFVENYVPKFEAHRYTMTYPAITSGKEIWFIITGAAKVDALKAVVFGERDLNQYPSQGIKPTRWFVDSEAVG
ncbi:6-phosphogluconolactonase [Roseiconus lacunae]|uniref:6-phosphogluconolactonase n=1 Tax=Roseiconus lacunae TaxID=2605694 RepID=A0ABT7PRM3_9BACT|nr:6-phosphogluconolactonase [Roseiconus lacunae]MCD0462610.1 6-phosphogluconolactonase [Roseiconus lacunae]MDM4019155.1 6-phosphogluconolactonase [Roseiconus lacunae]WRQ49009.1 6-phosphogluconolactonase [Stieleria sp. HD01]